MFKVVTYDIKLFMSYFLNWFRSVLTLDITVIYTVYMYMYMYLRLKMWGKDTHV